MNEPTATTVDARLLVRQLKVFEGDLKPFEVANAPDDPLLLFDEWFRAAAHGNAVEPHAMTLSTVDASGWPSARTLILKDFDVQGLYFASSSSSRKGSELAEHPRAALTFYWREFGRQIRVRGDVAPCSREQSCSDFAARSIEARAEALLGRQSQTLLSWKDWEDAIEVARDRLEHDAALTARDWTLYVLRPAEFEFWQADRCRRHDRLQFQRTAQGWTRRMLWP